jgi:VCBS repeat-containing protein
MFKRFVVSGTNKDNILTGTDRLDIIFGRKGDDVLDGRGGKDFLFGGKGDDQLFGGDGNDFLFGGKGNDFLDGGAGSDRIIADKGDDTVNFTLSENIGARDYYDGGKGFDTLQLTLTSAEAKAAESEIEAFKAFLLDGGKVFHFESFDLTVRNFENLVVVTAGGDNIAPVALGDPFTLNEDTPTVLNVLANDTDADGDSLSVVNLSEPANGTLSLVDGILTYTPDSNFFGSDSFTYQASDGSELSDVVTVNLTIDSVNDLPVAVDDPDVTAVADVVMPKIRVLVVGHEDDPMTLPNEGTTHLDAVNQLDTNKFDADWIINTTDTVWATVLSNYDVVVVGDSGYSDFAGETATGLFSALNTFVNSGNGVVTTGWFARALPLIEDPIARALADGISPIASDLDHDHAGTAGPSNLITISDPDHEIAGGVSAFQLTTRFGWELAGAIDMDDDPTDTIDTGATLLATGRATVAPSTTAPLPAIAYDDAVGMGRTAYVGGFYLSSIDFNPAQAHNDPVLDGIFERAIAWAAGGGAATASAKIDDALLLANDSDVETADADLMINFVALQDPSNGAAISLDANGDVVYTPSAAGLQQLLNGNPITDSFDYTIVDGDGATSLVAASVSLTVDTLL